MLNKRQRIGLWTASILTAIVGVVNLISAVTPNSPRRTELIEQFVPFDIRAGGHFFAAITGFILLTLAANLLRRKRVAWLLTVGLLIVTIISHLIKGLDYEESLLAGVLLAQLILMRNVFTAQSDRPSITQGIRVLIGALLFTLAYGTVGFFLLDRQYTVNFDLPEALLQTLAMFFTADNAGLEPTTRFGQFFANSIYLVGASTLAYALFMLLRPVLLRSSALDVERKRAKEIVEQYGKSSLARFTLFDDKTYYFSPSGKSFIGYVAKGRGAIALGDPIGPLEERQEIIVGFQLFCEKNDWYPAFYQTLPDDLDIYKSLGYRTVQIGEEAIVDLHSFTLQGKANQNLRNALNRLTKSGHQVKFYQPPIANELLTELRSVSDEWLKMMQGAEKKFSVGWFDYDYLCECEIVVVHTPEGTISAFANVISEYQKNEITIDLMRRRTHIEKGTMEFLFVSMFQHFQQLNYDGFNLGLSALSGVGETQNSPTLEKALKYLYEHLNKFYNFKGLHTFKDKFTPHWEPRYLVYPNLAVLPDVVVALVRADSGDRLLDYFKPGT
ncbi:bifunctional lysylphosphatidylglycerol flippase/synthetase MprF [Komarekiella sp. 'clone 1']|uniref:Bifunctional lysylphosphatidylglycerol flippase/synthetase MprF n=1 Tax=Komarekiella delphini-convector SJRDD-AB1 TaxID=2593771 RepID=A0AA40SUJ1_9NOST|nr:phosphatidylglycerol lysyltransferase domain-containing protein [Komarekiella delphini-convector]MBD6615268.1 bifunctional lysylphosphatidylglycerol flippase/synthetase MprF [Komarekiella delphini-convector SJRDD-AB1]